MALTGWVLAVGLGMLACERLGLPRRWDAACGFGPEGEARLGAMLLGRDVNRA